MILLLLGLVLRLTIAYVLWPNSGFETDLTTYQFWAQRLYELGPGGFYDPLVFADYPPGYLYLMWIGTHFLAFLHGGTFEAVATDAVKLGPILFDVLLAAALYAIVRRWASDRPDAERLGLVAAGLYLFNPVTWYDSALWGQTDAVGAFVVLLGVAALVRGNSEGAAALTVLAALVKPQFGVVLAPLVAAVLLRRHLLEPGSGPRHRPWAPASVARWLEREQGVLRLVTSPVVGLVLLVAMITPFGLTIPSFLERMVATAGGYSFLSVNAYNLWALLGSAGNDPLALGGGWSPDTVPLFGPLPGVAVGAALLAGAFLLGMLRAAWLDDRRSIVVVAIYLALAFFVLPTRVHERYLFPVFGLLPLLAVVDRRWLVALMALSVAAFINFHGILTTPLYATPNIENLLLGDLFRGPLMVAVSAGLATAAFVFVTWQLRPQAALRRDRYDVPVEPAWADEAPAVPANGYATAKRYATAAAYATAEGYPPPEGYVRAGFGSRPVGGARRPGIRALIGEALAPLLAVAAVRRDRSAQLATEPGGRLDRLDLLLLVVVLLATLGLRTFRLDKPFGMHFDEVYHARTATEFLQHWRYAMPHSIYEYTHPHLAKYVMAAGIVAFGNNRVVDEQALGFPATAAAVEQRWSPESSPSQRNGERLFVAGADVVHVLDLVSRRPEATIDVQASRLAVEEDGHALYMADADGNLWRLATTVLDERRGSAAADSTPLAAEQLAPIAGVDGELRWLGVAESRLIAISTGGTVVSLDPATGEESGRATIPGAAEAVTVTGGERVLVDPAQLDDVPAAAALLADLLGDSAARIEELLVATPAESVAVAGYLDDDQAASVQGAIDDGRLPGATIAAGSAVALASESGIVVRDARTLDELASVATAEPVTGLALVERGTDRPTLYGASGGGLVTVRLPEDGPPELGERLEMPNRVDDAIWNPSTALLHVPGLSQDGSGPTIYVLSPVSNSIFADAPLDFAATQIVLDAQPRRPAEDRADMLALAADGRLATIDVGSNAFAWRFPGVVAGSLMAVCLYLLARFLFARRSIAVIASLLGLADGMFFANARIAMNDTYVSLFIVAAFTLFVPLWLGRWRGRAALAAGFLGLGLLLGLALAAKWVAAYAIGAIGLLILVRSALGRLIALAAMIALTGLLGYLAITPAPETEGPQLNFLFLLLMLVLSVALAALIALRPVRMTREELRFATIAPVVAGVGLLVAGAMLLVGGAAVGPLSPGRALIAGAVLLAVGPAAYAAARVAARFGRGPLAVAMPAEPGVEPPAPAPPRGWMRPGSGFLGLPWLAVLAAITLIPLAVYVVSFVPWIELGNRWIADFPSGHTGQTFLDLQVSMYDYHNNLRATHAASSPWWAWPLDLKPVWFYKEDFAHATTAQIYDAGNLVLFWLSIPAIGFVAYQAWRRRSLPLTLIVVAVSCLWLPWARIDRVAFQYHIFTSLPFWFLGLAYFLAELWHGPSERTWLLARVAAAVAIIGPALLWLLRVPLCIVARTEQVNPGNEVCGALSRHLVLTDMQALGVLAAFGALALIGWLVWTGAEGGSMLDTLSTRPLLVPAVLTLALAGAVLALIGAAIPGRAVFERDVRAEEPALVALVLLSIPAYLVLRARDARRFVFGAIAAAFGWFVLWYPNIAALPLPRPLAEIYQGFLPTWNYAFQFGANQDAPNRNPLDYATVASLALLAAALVVAALYVARGWRVERAEERVLRALREVG